MRLKEEQRRLEKQESQLKVLEIIRSKPLYKVKEERFREEMELEMQKRQEELVISLKSIMKPIKVRELDIHKMRYLEEKRMKEL